VNCCGFPGGLCKKDCSVLKSAMDIIDKKLQVSERQLIDRLDSIEQQLQALQESLNAWFKQGNDE
jgi:hypothetical protein